MYYTYFVNSSKRFILSLWQKNTFRFLCTLVEHSSPHNIWRTLLMRWTLQKHPPASVVFWKIGVLSWDTVPVGSTTLTGTHCWESRGNIFISRFGLHTAKSFMCLWFQGQNLTQLIELSLEVLASQDQNNSAETFFDWFPLSTSAPQLV